jgi:hypothetical protein
MLTSSQMNDLESNLNKVISSFDHPSAKHFYYKIYRSSVEISIMVNNREYSLEIAFFQMFDDSISDFSASFTSNIETYNDLHKLHGRGCVLSKKEIVNPQSHGWGLFMLRCLLDMASI